MSRYPIYLAFLEFITEYFEALRYIYNFGVGGDFFSAKSAKLSGHMCIR